MTRSARRLALSPRDRRALLVCSVTVAGIVGVGRGGPAWRQWDHDVRARAAEAVRELRTLEAGAALLPAMRDSVAARRRRIDTVAVMLLDGASPAQAGAQLATVAGDLAAEAEVQVNAVQVRADSAYRGGVARVAVRLTATGDVTGLTELLRQIEGHELLLHVRELVVSQPAPAAPDNVPETLRFELLVEGLALDPRVRVP